MIHLINPDMIALSSYFSRKSSDDDAIRKQVHEIVEQVRKHKDAALISYAHTFDHVELDSVIVDESQIKEASEQIGQPLRTAIDRAFNNILEFHRHQLSIETPVETETGVHCWRKRVPIQKVGLYVPGGTAILFSTVLMLSIPAMVAGCPYTVLCTPPRSDGTIHPAVLYCAGKTGITKIVKAGGAQAIAAMAYGTESIMKVDKIFGPGNRYVTMAKQLVATDTCAIDMPAGPSEVMVLADSTSNPVFVAADILSQAEHGIDSQCILVVRDADTLRGKSFVHTVEHEIMRQTENLPRMTCIEGSLSRSVAIIVSSSDAMVEIANAYAPEHLIIQTIDADSISESIVHAGSVFIGCWAPESVGDYASGTNHTLPTAGWATSYSGLSVESFMKTITFQKLDASAIKELGPSVMEMAYAESLAAHANAVAVRIKALEPKENI